MNSLFDLYGFDYLMLAAGKSRNTAPAMGTMILLLLGFLMNAFRKARHKPAEPAWQALPESQKG